VKRLLLGTGLFLGLSGGAHATLCAPSDLSLTIGSTTYAPTACRDAINNGNPTQETANLNAAFGTAFSYLDKSDDVGQIYQGLSFTVTAPQVVDGAWTVAWADTNGNAPLNLPVTMSFEVGLFGGNNGAGYELTNVLLPITPNTGSGTFDIDFLNGGGQMPMLSHLTLTGVLVASGPVPEPMSAALLGVGLMGLAWVRRRGDLKA
jgi:hypothetical protein